MKDTIHKPGDSNNIGTLFSTLHTTLVVRTEEWTSAVPFHSPAEEIRRKTYARPRYQQGTATVELAIILPLMLIILFAIVDFGKLINVRYEIAKLAQQGGLMASRDVRQSSDIATLITTLQSMGNESLGLTGTAQQLANMGNIYIWRIETGTSPTITMSGNSGALTVTPSISSSYTKLGLSDALYTSLSTSSGPDITQVTVVEVFYKYQPITPLSNLIRGLLTGSGGGFIVSSKAVYPP